MKQIYSWLFVLAFIPIQLMAQQTAIKGKVTDAANGTGLPGVSIMVNTPTGQRPGTLTNANGEFTITAPANATELVFTYTGMEPRTEVIRGRTVINVQLSATAQELQQVVVVGYGTQRKANLTGAVDQVTSEVLENRSLTNLNQGLQGVLPNLNIRPLDGKPNQAPRFNIRGATSIGQGGNALV
ncbi:MAG: carboxypeptidase-like regulatory domain-containing protein, partial [Flavisolibacter sp.]|nr:carboxypeptidase-like regulatory domain-containing protein [Flavisolibacter sp.]